MIERNARLLLSFTFFAAACGVEDERPIPVPGPIEVKGAWHSAFGGTEEITEGKWGAAAIIEHDNQNNSAILQNPADDAFNPSKFAKVVWTEPRNGRFHYCTVDFGLATLAEAKASTRSADARALDTGCGSFPWTELAPPIELLGRYTSPFGSTETIDSDTWRQAGDGFETAQTVIEYDNATNTAIVQNPDDDTFNPSKFAKLVWTEPVAGVFHYCTVDFGRETAEGARTSTKTADADALDGDGCGGFAWTKLTRSVE